LIVERWAVTDPVQRIIRRDVISSRAGARMLDRPGPIAAAVLVAAISNFSGSTGQDAR